MAVSSIEQIIAIASGQSLKIEAFEWFTVQKGTHVIGVPPLFDEPRIQQLAPTSDPLDRAAYIVVTKAAEHVTHVVPEALVSALILNVAEAAQGGQEIVASESLQAYIVFTDSLQCIIRDGRYRMILEKPQHPSVDSWLNDPYKGAMAQSGETIHIVTGVSVLDAHNLRIGPKKAILRTEVKMRAYSMEEARTYAKIAGWRQIQEIAGGITIRNPGRSLYDGKSPITVDMKQSDTDDSPFIPVFSVPCLSEVSDDALLRFVYGAERQLFESLIKQFESP